MALSQLFPPGKGVAELSSLVSADSVKSDILSPIRVLCESRQLQFFVVLQSAATPTKRFWSSSEQLNNLCGSLILEFATFIDTKAEKAVEDDLKLDVEDSYEFAKSPSPELPLDGGLTFAGEERDECVLLPEEDVDDVDKEGGEVNEEIVPLEPLIGDKEFLGSDGSKNAPRVTTSRLKVRRKRSTTEWLLNPLPNKKTKSDYEDDENLQYLGDDLDFVRAEDSVKAAGAATNPAIWKDHQFDQGIRPSTIKKLFMDKLKFDKRRGGHIVEDLEYSPFLLHIIRKRNPYCVFEPKRQCQ